MRVISPKNPGGPEVLVVSEAPTPVPGEGELLVKIEAIGVNFMDHVVRSQGNPAKEPLRIGFEGAGVVEAVGPAADPIKVGDRIAWAYGESSYATHAIIKTRQAVPLPDSIDAKTAAASLVIGLTAHMVVVDVARLKPGRSILVYGVSSGLGLAVAQVAKIAGAKVFGVTNEPGKGNLIKSARIDHPLELKGDHVAEVRRLTEGRGVNVIVDTIGGHILKTGIGCAARRALLVFLAPGGMNQRIDVGVLARNGSLVATRPTLRDFVPTRDDLTARAAQVFTWIEDKTLAVPIDGAFPLAAARLAHERIVKGSLGKFILVP